MNKKIKSLTEIVDEISIIFDKSKKDDELVSGIINFHLNITGKELIKKKQIEFLICMQILRFDAVNNRKLKRNKKLFEILPELKFLKQARISGSPLNKAISSISKSTSAITEIGIILISIVSNNEEFQKFLVSDDYFNMALNNSVPLKKLFNFLNNNRDVSKLLERYINAIRKNFLSEMIQNDFASLNSIFIFFDVNKTLKQNTEHFYKLLNKKYSRQTIQTTIRRDLEKIKDGRFYLPVL